MRILIISNIASGLYEFRRDLIAKLCESHEVFISCPQDLEYQEKLEPCGCRFIDTSVDRRGLNPKRDLVLFQQYRKLLKELKPNLVITYTIKPNIYGGFACRLSRTPYAVNITGLGTAFQKDGFLKRFVTSLYKISIKDAKVVFFENQGNLNTFNRLKICKKEQCKLLNGAGVDLDFFSPTKYPEGDITHFLFVGRIMKEKGIDELFASMKRLNQENKACVLDVLGRCEEDYAQEIEEGQKQGWLNYYGYQKDVRPFIEKAHCFVLPSWHEGMANTNLECAASGRPIITSNIPGCMEAVKAGESGFLCKTKNADSLYKTMEQFLALSREQQESMGLAGRKHMEEIFDKKKVVEETLKGLKL